MFSEPADTDVLDDCDPSAFQCLYPNEHPWIPDVFEGLSDNQLTQDDLLTDAVSEFMKFKTDLPDIDLLSENICIADLLAEDEHLRPTNRASENAEKFYLPRPDILDCGNSSGYASGAVSSGTPSPTNSRSKTDCPDMKLSKFCTTTNRFLNPPVVAKRLKIEPTLPELHVSRALANQDRPELKQHTVVKTTVPATSTGGNSRVRFIVRPNPVVSLQGRNKQNLEHSVFGNIKRVQTIPKSRYPAETQKKICLDASSISYSHKGSNRLHFMHASDGHSNRSASPTHTGSQSSSDSDMRDSLEDDGVAAFSELYPDSARLVPYELTGSCQPVTRFKPSADAAKNYTFTRTGSPAPRLQSLHSLSYDDCSEKDFLQTSRLSSHTLFRGQASQSGLLVLTDEEKRTLLAEGYTIPTRLPLSKQEERNLKKVRRKIKNKISAQESRRKKKEYVEALERKLNVCVQETLDLKRRNENLESTNRSLLGQLRLMQQLLNKSKNCSSNANAVLSSTHSETVKSSSRNGTNTSPSGGGSASTCLMVFALCFAALLAGQPTELHNRSSLDSGLTFGPRHHGIWNNLIAQGPGGLVSGSLSHIGYTWSANHRGNKALRDKQTGSPGPNSDWQSNWNATAAAARELLEEAVGPAVCSKTAASRPGECPRPSLSGSEHEVVARSRLLGSPSELEECGGPSPQSFWSYWFGGAFQRGPTACTCASQDHRERSINDFDSGLTIELDLFESNELDAGDGNNTHTMQWIASRQRTMANPLLTNPLNAVGHVIATA